MPPTLCVSLLAVHPHTLVVVGCIVVFVVMFWHKEAFLISFHHHVAVWLTHLLLLYFVPMLKLIDRQNHGHAHPCHQKFQCIGGE